MCACVRVYVRACVGICTCHWPGAMSGVFLNWSPAYVLEIGSVTGPGAHCFG